MDMGRLAPDMDIIPLLVAVNDHQDPKAARIIILHLTQGDILPLHTHLVPQGREVQDGLHNNLVLWGLLLPMDQLHLLPRVLMTCTIGQDGVNQAMGVLGLHTQVNILQVTEVGLVP